MTKLFSCIKNLFKKKEKIVQNSVPNNDTLTDDEHQKIVDAEIKITNSQKPIRKTSVVRISKDNRESIIREWEK